MFSLFDYEQIFNAYEREIRKKERQEGIRQGIQLGIQLGTQLGIQLVIQRERQEIIQKIAYKMFKNNSSDDDILDMLEISPEELNRLKAEYNKI